MEPMDFEYSGNSTDLQEEEDTILNNKFLYLLNSDSYNLDVYTEKDEREFVIRLNQDLLLLRELQLKRLNERKMFRTEMEKKRIEQLQMNANVAYNGSSIEYHIKVLSRRWIRQNCVQGSANTPRMTIYEAYMEYMSNSHNLIGEDIATFCDYIQSIYGTEFKQLNTSYNVMAMGLSLVNPEKTTSLLSNTSNSSRKRINSPEEDKTRMNKLVEPFPSYPRTKRFVVDDIDDLSVYSKIKSRRLNLKAINVDNDTRSNGSLKWQISSSAFSSQQEYQQPYETVTYPRARPIRFNNKFKWVNPNLIRVSSTASSSPPTIDSRVIANSTPPTTPPATKTVSKVIKKEIEVITIPSTPPRPPSMKNKHVVKVEPSE